MLSVVKNNYMNFFGSGETFNVKLEPINLRDSFYRESCRAAEEIYDLKVGKIHLLYSGGIDSEYALNVFLSIGIKVVPVLIKFNNGYNEHELKYAIDFCQSNQLNPLIIDFDFDRFVESGRIIEVATESKTSTYHYPATAEVCRMLDGTVILGDGEFYVKRQENNDWNIEIDQHELSVYNFMKLHNIHGTSHFNCYTPEMAAAWLLKPRMIELTNNSIPGKLGSISSKYILYNECSPFKLIERQKFTGYETIEKSPIFSHPNINKLLELGKEYNGKFSVPYKQFVKQYIKNYEDTRI